MTTNAFHTGFIAIVGRPNVGKSTLLNRLVGQKVSIVSRKAQTTRHRINGIRTDDNTQFVFVDTPGFQTRFKSRLNDSMNRGVTSALVEVDVVLFVIEAGVFNTQDAAVLKLLPKTCPVILVINKADTFQNKNQLLPFLARMSETAKVAEIHFVAMVPVSAQKDLKIEVLLNAIEPLLPEGPPLYEAEQVTDRSERFLAAELLREKVFRLAGDELPYSVTVEIEQFIEEPTLRRIHAAILVDRDAQKAILIGHHGERLKKIASQARSDMEQLFGSKVFLEVWVKVKSGWADSTKMLHQLGYD